MKVFVVDDTAIYRKILSDAVDAIEGLELVGTAPRGSIALHKLEGRDVDLVLLDIFMPDMDGLETMTEIKARYPKMHVVMVSGATTRDAGITIKALRNGAADFIAKPKAPSFQEGMPIIIEEVRRVTKALGLKVGAPKTPFAGKAGSATDQKFSTAPPRSFGLVVIGVSTGGPKTLSSIIPKLPGDLDCPVLIVQHMPPKFTASLAQHLEKESALTVKEAECGEPVLPGNVYLAPGGYHMMLKASALKTENEWIIELNNQPPVNSCRPSVDVLFESVASAAKCPVLAVILTGMGEDGANGLETLKKGICYCLSQSRATCVVYGMPHAVKSRGLSDEVLDTEQFAERITELVRRR